MTSASRGAHYNRHSRRSGGDKRFRIPVGGSVNASGASLAIPCFEQRHAECTGTNTLFGGACECRCHKDKP